MQMPLRLAGTRTLHARGLGVDVTEGRQHRTIAVRRETLRAGQRTGQRRVARQRGRVDHARQRRRIIAAAHEPVEVHVVAAIVVGGSVDAIGIRQQIQHVVRAVAAAGAVVGRSAVARGRVGVIRVIQAVGVQELVQQDRLEVRHAGRNRGVWRKGVGVIRQGPETIERGDDITHRRLGGDGERFVHRDVDADARRSEFSAHAVIVLVQASVRRGFVGEYERARPDRSRHRRHQRGDPGRLAHALHGALPVSMRWPSRCAKACRARAARTKVADATAPLRSAAASTSPT